MPSTGVGSEGILDGKVQHAHVRGTQGRGQAALGAVGRGSMLGFFFLAVSLTYPARPLVPSVMDGATGEPDM